MDSADVLPVGIHSPAMRTGFVSGIGQRFTGDGSLMTLTDLNSLEFTTQQIAQIEPRVQQLVSVLNQFGHQEMGNELNLGILKIDVRPEVRYYAPVHAVGITPNWTVGVGVPIVRYENKLSLSQAGSNLNAIRDQVGGLSNDLDAAFKELEIGLVGAARDELAKKGYKPLTDRAETIFGDIQVASLYRFYSSPRVSALARTTLNLPTGPGDDPDDLAELNIFGQTAVDQTALVAYKPHRRVQLSAKANYRFNVPDRIVKRVPKNSEDTLPGPESKEKVKRKIGDAVMVGASATLGVTKTWSVALGYEGTQKFADSYQGDRDSNYSLLAKSTRASAGRMRVGVGYDTTTAYFDKEAVLPAIVSYEYADTIRGTNTERQTLHEVTLTLFF